MKVNKLANRLGKKSKELIQEIDDPRVTHHNHEVPEDILALFDVEEKKIKEAREEQEAGADSSETDAVEEAVLDDVKPVLDLKQRNMNAFEVFQRLEEDTSQCPYTAEQIELGCRCLGNKSKYWKWRHILNG